MNQINGKSIAQSIAIIFMVGMLLIVVVYTLSLTMTTLRLFSLIPQYDDPTQNHEYPEPSIEPISENQLDPATALTNSKPTIFMFYPTDVCTIQYCRLPELEFEKLQNELGDAVDFVVVTTHAMSYNESRHHIDYMPFDNWNIYPVEPYVSWLPKLTDTEFGWGLDSVKFVFVAADGVTGQLIASIDQFLQSESLLIEMKSSIQPITKCQSLTFGPISMRHRC